MQLECPKCGTRDARVSTRLGPIDYLKTVFGVYQMRCRRCSARWQTSVLSSGDWKYARCPRCYRQQLTTWSEQYYRAPFTTVAKLRLGAAPYRCAACRCNFASFKPCKEKFSWRHQTRVEAGGESSENAREENGNAPQALVGGDEGRHSED